MCDLLPERRNPLAQLSNFLRNFLRRFHTVWSDTIGSENVRSNGDHDHTVFTPFGEPFELLDSATLLSAGTQS
jgi:hypothetical protein